MNKIKLSLLVVLFALSSAFTFHKFYVGVFQVDYFKEKKAVQITARLFIDDLEQNTLAADALGIKTIWLKEGMTIEKDIFLSTTN